MFSSRSFMVSGLTFKFLIFFELIFMYKNHEMVMMSLVRWWSSFFFFTHGCPVFPAPFIEVIVLSLLFISCSFFVIIHMCLGLFLGFHFYSLSYVSFFFFLPIPFCFVYCGFVIQIKIRKCDTSSFVLFSQNWFDCLRSFVVLDKL